MAEPQFLTIADAESGYRAISDLIIKYGGFPTTFKASNTTVRWNMVSDTTCIGLYPLQGAIYLRKYISGSYVAQLPFQIIYKASTTTNKASIEAQDLVTNLAKWLEDCDVKFLDEHITLEEIVRTTPVYIVSQSEKYTEYAVNLNFNYSYK